MRQVQQWYEQTQSMAAEFSQQSYLAALDISESSGGRMLLDRKARMRWLYETPEKQDFLIVKDTLWYYRPEDEQVLIDSFKSVLISDLPIAFLLGLGNIVEDFSYQSGCRNDDSFYLHLKDRKSAAQNGAGSSSLKDFVLAVSANGEPEGAQIEDVNGNTTAVKFAAVETNKTLSENSFATNFPSGVDIVDRRVQ